MLGPLAPDDAARLRMGTLTNPMVIAVAIVLDGAIDQDALRERLWSLAERHERFRARVADSTLPLRAPRWSLAPFDLDAHLDRAHADDDDAALAAIVTRRMSAPLDPRRPLWDLARVDRPSGTALVLRVHHCIADGTALVRMLFDLTDEGASFAPAPPPRPARRATGNVLYAARRALALRADSASALRAPLTGAKDAAIAPPVELAAAKRAAHALGATVNDLVGGVTAGALRRVLAARGPLPARVRALVPVHDADDGADGNHYASVFVRLPIAEPDARARVRAFKREMDAVKRTGASAASRRLIALASLSGAAERAGVRLLSRGASVMLGNVAGAPVPLSLCGCRIAWMTHWAPTPGSIGLGVNVHGYAGALRVAVSADTGLSLRAAEVAAALASELAALTA